MPTLLSMLAPVPVVVTILGAIKDDKMIIMATLSYQRIASFYILAEHAPTFKTIESLYTHISQLRNITRGYDILSDFEAITKVFGIFLTGALRGFYILYTFCGHETSYQMYEHYGANHEQAEQLFYCEWSLSFWILEIRHYAGLTAKLLIWIPLSWFMDKSVLVSYHTGAKAWVSTHQ